LRKKNKNKDGKASMLAARLKLDASINAVFNAGRTPKRCLGGGAG
jgi:hypothetical protein